MNDSETLLDSGLEFETGWILESSNNIGKVGGVDVALLSGWLRASADANTAFKKGARDGYDRKSSPIVIALLPVVSFTEAFLSASTVRVIAAAKTIVDELRTAHVLSLYPVTAETIALPIIGPTSFAKGASRIMRRRMFKACTLLRIFLKKKSTSEQKQELLIIKSHLCLTLYSSSCSSTSDRWGKIE